MRSVLVVDDDARVRQGLSTLVQWNAINVDRVLTARNGREALAHIENDQIDIILSDVKMPDIDGLELAKRVQEKGLSIPLILLSAYDDFEYARSACRYGVKEYILKPIDSEKINRLEYLVNNLLGQRDSRDKLVMLVTSDEFKKKLRTAISSGDLEYLETFLNSPLVKTESDLPTVTQMAIRIIESVSAENKDILTAAPVSFPSARQVIGTLMEKKDKEGVLEYLSEILSGIVTFRLSKQKSHQTSLISLVEKKISKEFCYQNFNINTLADSMSLSANYLSTIYKKNKGENLSTRILRERIENAKTMIGNPKVNVGIVARSVGFTDGHYFARVFKKNVGCTPTEYRNLQLSISQVEKK